jgi:hypothetical protein
MTNFFFSINSCLVFKSDKCFIVLCHLLTLVFGNLTLYSSTLINRRKAFVSFRDLFNINT